MLLLCPCLFQSRLSLPAPPTPPPNKAEIIDQPISPLRKYASSDVLHRVSPNKQKLPSADGLTRRDADFAERLEVAVVMVSPYVDV